MPKIDNFLYENHRGSLTLTLLNVLNVLNVIIVLNVLNVLKMPKDPSLACWALVSFSFLQLKPVLCPTPGPSREVPANTPVTVCVRL